MKDDLISKTAAIEAMRKAKDKSELHRMLVQLPSAQPGWIPVTERLPQNGYWLWSANGGVVKKDFYWDGHWELAEKYGYEVLAWMPLPTPYREGGQDGTD